MFVPSSLSGLRELVVGDGIGPAPFLAHAVTDALRAAYPEGADEEWEYVASSAAARASVSVLGADDPPRRVVVAVDAATVRPVDGDDPTLVEVDQVVPYRHVASVLVDDADAADDVRAAVTAWAQAEAGDPEAGAVLERCLGHELGWFASQEIGDLLE